MVLRKTLESVVGIETVLPVALRKEWIPDPDLALAFPAATFRLFTSEQDSLNVLHDADRFAFREKVGFRGVKVRLRTYKVSLCVLAKPQDYYDVLDPLHDAVRRALLGTGRVSRLSEPSEVALVDFETHLLFVRTFLVEIKK